MIISGFVLNIQLTAELQGRYLMEKNESFSTVTSFLSWIEEETISLKHSSLYLTLVGNGKGDFL